MGYVELSKAVLSEQYQIKCSKCGHDWLSVIVPCQSRCPMCNHVGNYGVFPFAGLNYTVPRGVTE